MYCNKKFEGNSQLYSAQGYVTITRRKCNISGRCPATVNVENDPVLVLDILAVIISLSN